MDDERSRQVSVDRRPDPAGLVQHPSRSPQAVAAGIASRDGPAHRAAGLGAAVPDGADSAGGVARSGRSKSRGRCATSIACGGRRRCTVPAGWSRRWIRRPGSTTSTRASARPARTSRTRRCRRPTTTSRKASRGWRPRPAPASGARRWPWAAACFGIQCKVYMVRVSFEQKPYRKAMMQTYGAEVTASPSEETECGRAILARDPDCPGSLGIAISEAVEVAARGNNTKYALGSVLNHVLLHQTVIGLEAIEQMKLAGDEPDVLVGCTGGGSNFAGIAFPFLGARTAGRGLPEHAGGGRRAGRLPVADPRRVRLRFRRHGQADAAAEDVHAGQHLHPARHPYRWPALPRHGAAGQPPARPGRDRGHQCATNWSASRPASSSPGPKASSRHRKPTTPSPQLSAKP